MKSFVIRITFSFADGGVLSSEICIQAKNRKIAVGNGINSFYRTLEDFYNEIPDGSLEIDYCYEL